MGTVIPALLGRGEDEMGWGCPLVPRVDTGACSLGRGVTGHTREASWPRPLAWEAMSEAWTMDLREVAQDWTGGSR